MGHDLRKRIIVVLGSRSVGKSSLVLKFTENQFDDKYYPTIEKTESKSIKYNGLDYECKIMDIAGQDEYSIFKSTHAIGVHGFILVYSTASRRSFDMVEILYNKIVEFRGTEDIPCVIVGTKTDLAEMYREVQPSEAKDLAQKKGAAWVETSAKTNINVVKVFELCVAEIEKRSPGKVASASENKTSSCRIM